MFWEPLSLGPAAAESGVKLNMFVLRVSFQFQVSYCLILFLGWDSIPSWFHICLIFLFSIQNTTLAQHLFVQHLMAPISGSLKDEGTSKVHRKSTWSVLELWFMVVVGTRLDSWPNTDCSISSSLRSTSPSAGSLVETEPVTCKEVRIQISGVRITYMISLNRISIFTI